MNKELLINTQFKQNCEYKTSSVSNNIGVPSQNINIYIDIDNDINSIYFDDIITVYAEVYQVNNIPINTGRIEFYFIDDKNNIILINKNKQSCYLNNQGKTAIKFKPTTSGQIYAQYKNNTGIYDEKKSENLNIILNKIPVNIDFIKKPAVVEPQKKINLKVKVTDINDNNIKYGLVTFLHYDLNENDSTPKIIGNPVPVVNGYAEINYYPIQENAVMSDLTTNVEHIKAYYNYSGTWESGSYDKGEYAWKYYQTSMTETDIHISNANTFTIGIENVEYNNNYICNNNSTINLKSILSNKNNERIVLNSDDVKCIFHIKGEHFHPSKTHTSTNSRLIYNNIEKIPYELKLNGTINNDEIECQINNLLPGSYTVTADLYIYNESTLNEYEYDNDDKEYIKIKSSNSINIISEYDEISEHTINLTFPQTIRTNTDLDIIANINGLTQEEMEILNEKKCFFIVEKVNTNNIKEYNGILQYDNNKLIGISEENIIFTTPGIYHISFRIDNGIFINSVVHSDNDFGFYIPYAQRSRSDITIIEDFILEIRKNYNPYQIDYELKGLYINENEILSVDVDIKKENEVNNYITKHYTLTNEINTIQDSIQNIESGTYNVQAHCQGVTSDIIEYIVAKDNITQYLLDSSKEIFASINNTIGIILSCNDNALNIDIDKVKAYIYDENKNNEREVFIIENKIIDNQLFLTIQPEIWEEGEWYIKITYLGDSKINPYSGQYDKFITKRETPNITLTPLNNNKIQIQVKDENNHILNNNIIIMHFIFRKDNSEISNGLLITDADGKAIIESQESWWDTWNNIVFICNPYSATLINIFKNNNIPRQALINANYNIYDYTNKSDTNLIYQQITNNDYNYLFNTYKTYQSIIRRPF